MRVNVQMPRSSAERAARLEQADVRRAYLEEAMAVQRRRLEDRWSEYDAKVAKGEESYRLLRDTDAEQAQGAGAPAEGEAGRLRPARRRPYRQGHLSGDRLHRPGGTG